MPLNAVRWRSQSTSLVALINFSNKPINEVYYVKHCKCMKALKHKAIAWFLCCIPSTWLITYHTNVHAPKRKCFWFFWWFLDEGLVKASNGFYLWRMQTVYKLLLWKTTHYFLHRCTYMFLVLFIKCIHESLETQTFHCFKHEFMAQNWTIIILPRHNTINWASTDNPWFYKYILKIWEMYHQEEYSRYQLWTCIFCHSYLKLGLSSTILQWVCRGRRAMLSTGAIFLYSCAHTIKTKNFSTFKRNQ